MDRMGLFALLPAHHCEQTKSHAKGFTLTRKPLTARLQLQPTIAGTDCMKLQLFQPMESWKIKKLKVTSSLFTTILHRQIFEVRFSHQLCQLHSTSLKSWWTFNGLTAQWW